MGLPVIYRPEVFSFVVLSVRPMSSRKFRYLHIDQNEEPRTHIWSRESRMTQDGTSSK